MRSRKRVGMTTRLPVNTRLDSGEASKATGSGSVQASAISAKSRRMMTASCCGRVRTSTCSIQWPLSFHYQRLKETR